MPPIRILGSIQNLVTTLVCFHPHSPAPGVEWYFNIGRVQSDGTTAVWSTENPASTLLAARPHGILQFVEEPISAQVSCDINQDSECNADDFDLLSTAIRAGLKDTLYDLDKNQLVNPEDRAAWVKDEEFMNTWFGDANLDGEFNSTDLVNVFQAAEYEDATPENSGWATGDWNGDQDFTSTDLVVAFQDGGYELGPRVGVNVVPEPSQRMALLCFTILISLRRRR